MRRKQHRRRGRGPNEVLQKQLEEKRMVGTEVGTEEIKARAGKLGDGRKDKHHCIRCIIEF